MKPDNEQKRASMAALEIVSVIEAHYLDNYRVWLRFNTGEEGIVDLSDVVERYSAAKPLQDKALFAAFVLDGWPTLAWPCGFDMAGPLIGSRMSRQPCNTAAQ